MSEKAGDRLSVDLVAKRSRWRILTSIIEALSGSQSSTFGPVDEFLFKDRTTAEIVHRSTIDEGPGVAEVKASIQKDLETMDLEEFCRTYGVENYPRS